ncbi:MAG: hypothetical protein ABW133_14650 [Polyangiaceae bacterium]
MSRRAPGKVVPSSGGTTVQALRNALQDLVGDSVFQAAMASLRPDLREQFEPVSPLTWVPVDVIHTCVARIAEHAGRPFDELMDAGVEKAGEKTLRTAWRMLLRVTADRALVRRAPVLYSKWRNIGRLEVRGASDGRVELHLVEWPGMDERSVRTLGITIGTVMRLAGRKQVRVQSASTADGAKYNVTWQS